LLLFFLRKKKEEEEENLIALQLPNSSTRAELILLAGSQCALYFKRFARIVGVF
jgi:hypothetical protein